MDYFKYFRTRVNNIQPREFEKLALDIFRYQARNNHIYSKYIQNLNREIGDVNSLDSIPFLPIDFFKTHTVKAGDYHEETFFESSGTTGLRSKHLVRDVSFYHQIAKKTFEECFGPLEDCIILGYLPSYLVRSNSSLVNMVDYFISKAMKGSDFYLSKKEKLIEFITNNSDLKIILFSVTFALLDLAENFKHDLQHVSIIETGGMKGRKKELTRDELYGILRRELNANNIYSEYGMTELLSQAYAKNGLFNNSSTLKVIIREVNDPFTFADPGTTGGINVIDLGNIHSCSFVETKDLGKYNSDGTFEVLGRFDNSDIRGCNLLLN